MGLIREIAIEVPHLELPDALKAKIGALLKMAILKNIKESRQADGSPLKRNSPGYQDHKKKMGWTWQGQVLPLVASEHRFTRPELWSAEWEGEGVACKLTIEPTSGEDTQRISASVQMRGYTGWFAASPEAVEAALQLVRDWIRAEIRKAVQRGINQGL